MQQFVTLFAFLGIMGVVTLVLWIRHRKTADHHRQEEKPSQSEAFTGESHPSQSRIPFFISPEQKEQRRREERIRLLNETVMSLKELAQGKLWGREDIEDAAGISLDDTDMQYIAEQVPSPLAMSIWALHRKIQEHKLTDDEIIKIIDTGTENLVDEFFETYSQSPTWTMSYLLLDRLIAKDPLLVYRFTNLSKETMSVIIDKLSAYELQGYRMRPIEPDESYDSWFRDLQASTDDHEIEVSYYAYAQTNIIHHVEQYLPQESKLRDKAFDKILAGSANLIEMIRGVDDLSEDEIRKIFDRNHKEEISVLFDVFNTSDIVAIFPADFAIKVALQLVESDYEDEIKDNYPYSEVPASEYQAVIGSLSADELLGYDARGDGNYDIIKLIEDKMSDDNELRKLAFAKMRTSSHFVDAIERWDNVTEDEITAIMETKDDSLINALFGRDDSDDIVCNLPQEMAIKIRLELLYPIASQTVADKYGFNDEQAFRKVIAELTADELLGFRSDPTSNDADYDIVKLIEDEMGDNDDLRKLAFAKICGSKRMTDAIARWENVTEEEIKSIMETKNDDLINALFGRNDSDNIVCDLPQEMAIKIRLELIYPDARETVENDYQFNDEQAFRNVIAELTADELLGFRSDPTSNDADYDIIKLIEDEMNDDDELRKLAFAKICGSKRMADAIARWENVTEEEVKSIMDSKDEHHIDALLGRNDSESIVCDFPQEIAIKIRLELIYPSASQTVADNYEFNDKQAFKNVIAELSADELLGINSTLNDAGYDIIKFIEDEMGDDEALRKLAFAKICGSKDMSDAIARWDNVSDEETPIIIGRGIYTEITALMERDDADSLISSVPDDYIIRQHILDGSSNVSDEFANRIDDQKFRKKVERVMNTLSVKGLNASDRESSVDDLADEKLIRAKLWLTDFSDCSFDNDDVANEYSERMNNDEGFASKVRSLAANIGSMTTSTTEALGISRAFFVGIDFII